MHHRGTYSSISFAAFDANLLKVPHKSMSQQWRSVHLALKFTPIAGSSNVVIQCIAAYCIP